MRSGEQHSSLATHHAERKTSRAILDLKIQRDKLQQYQKRITTVTNRETEIAKECLRNGNKQKALLALRRKKYQESLLSKTDQQLAQLQALTSDVEFALVQKDVLFGLQQGTAVLKEINKEIGGLDKVEMILSESEEARAYQEVSIHCCDYTNEQRLMIGNRKSVRCSRARCPTKMRMLWRMNWRLWKENKDKRKEFLACQMRQRSLLESFPMLQLNHPRSGQRREGWLERQGRRVRPYQHDLKCDVVRQAYFVVERGVGGAGGALVHTISMIESIKSRIVNY